MSTTDTLMDLMKGLKDGAVHELHPKQKEFLTNISKAHDWETFTAHEKLCILHCLSNDTYLDLHRVSLNNLIQKYAKK